MLTLKKRFPSLQSLGVSFSVIFMSYICFIMYPLPHRADFELGLTFQPSTHLFGGYLYGVVRERHSLERGKQDTRYEVATGRDWDHVWGQFCVCIHPEVLFMLRLTWVGVPAGWQAHSSSVLRFESVEG